MNTQPINWHFAFLRTNPFIYIVPPNDPNEIMWAGMTGLKAQFDRLFFEAKTTPATQVSLNWGAYGSGKTHSSLYFSLPERLPQVAGEQVADIVFLRIRTPKDPSKPDIILYKDILDAIRFKRLRQIVRQTIEGLGLEEATAVLQDITESEVLGRAVTLLGLEPDRTGNLRLFEPGDISSDWHILLESYFFSKNTTSELRRLRLSRGIETSQERFRILAAIFRCLVGIKYPSDLLDKHCRIILWIDEMEDLIYFATKQYRPFTQGLRELIDRLPAFFTLMMNFTLASPEVFEDTTVVLGEALVERITRNIYFQEPNEDDAFAYALEMLRLFRIQMPSDQNLPATYPFNEDSLKRVIDMLPRRTPREINKRCSEVITEALMRGIISAPGEGIITSNFISELEEEQMNNMDG